MFGDQPRTTAFWIFAPGYAVWFWYCLGVSQGGAQLLTMQSSHEGALASAWWNLCFPPHNFLLLAPIPLWACIVLNRPEVKAALLQQNASKQAAGGDDTTQSSWSAEPSKEQHAPIAVSFAQPSEPPVESGSGWLNFLVSWRLNLVALAVIVIAVWVVPYADAIPGARLLLFLLLIFLGWLALRT